MVFIGTNGTTSGWIERYDPSFAKWVGSSMHFAFVFHGARLKRGGATPWNSPQNVGERQVGEQNYNNYGVWYL